MLAGVGVVSLGWVAQGSNWAPMRRQSVLARIDPIARQFGKYTAYRLSSEEFVGYHPRDGVLDSLRSLGYEMNLLSAAKYHPETGDLDEWSIRRVDPDHPRWQWHVHVWERSNDRAEVFSHYEYRPDPIPIDGEGMADMQDRLREHYNPTWDRNASDEEATYFLGEACNRVIDQINRP